MAFQPHGVCWLWDKFLISLHLIGDEGTGICYFLIPAIAIYVYKVGKLHKLRVAFPALWCRGIAFVLFCGFNHHGAALEIFVGGVIYYLTGVNKICMLIASVMFVHEFWRRRAELVLICQILEKAQTLEDEG